MVDDGQMSLEDYNYPIVHFYKYRNVAMMRGAEKKGQMIVEYAVMLRIELSPKELRQVQSRISTSRYSKRGLVGS